MDSWRFSSTLTWFSGLVVMISVSHRTIRVVHRRSPVRPWAEPRLCCRFKLPLGSLQV
ncbi:hypothetical protein BDQ12DRAFT_688567 [Crucibulum laeve]|uniref:Uncharacterized protein n=1 Tax=Crucibulum laeve TaxID=68775 RepID=A0A5C3LQJ2_9AGAR|nr:hypothetical protein BDQ12DRAFT_688567 [Crucibulum laeve]